MQPHCCSSNTMTLCVYFPVMHVWKTSVQVCYLFPPFCALQELRVTAVQEVGLLAPQGAGAACAAPGAEVVSCSAGLDDLLRIIATSSRAGEGSDAGVLDQDSEEEVDEEETDQEGAEGDEESSGAESEEEEEDAGARGRAAPCAAAVPAGKSLPPAARQDEVHNQSWPCYMSGICKFS